MAYPQECAHRQPQEGASVRSADHGRGQAPQCPRAGDRLRYLGDALWDRFNASREDILWYYGAVVDVLDAGDVRLHDRMLDGTTTLTDLDRLIDELEVAVE